jgi:arginine-tRNA-protein transferase
VNHPSTRVLLPQELAFYTTPPHECSYLPERRAVTIFVDPYAPMDHATYSALADLGFRRSGAYVYRPRCPGCSACVPVRVPVDQFQPDRSQRRTLERNRDLKVTIRPPLFDPDHFELYRRYTRTRHPGGGMDSDEPAQYRGFLISAWAETRFVEFREGERLLAVAVTDVMDQGLSAVYTFFDPDEPRRGLGVNAVLWQIEYARRLGLPWVYLGYWISETPKMSYKTRYHPLEAWSAGEWHPLGDEFARWTELPDEP